MKPKNETPLYINKQIELCEMLLRKENNTTKNHKEILKLTKRLDFLKLEFDRISNGVCVSDHALIRYMDRGMAHPVEEIRDHILSLVKDIHMGDGKYMIAEGLYAIIKKGVVATVLDENKDFKSGGMK